LLEQVLEESQEIDGDACLSVVQQPIESVKRQDPNESMFMADVLDNYDLAFRRYSVVGNDSSFKAYTRDYSFTVSNQLGRSTEEQELSVSLKDFNPEKGNSKEEDGQREQYRVIHSDLLFIVHFSGHQKSKGKAERSLNDFRKVIDALRKLYPGCFVPDIPK